MSGISLGLLDGLDGPDSRQRLFDGAVDSVPGFLPGSRCVDRLDQRTRVGAALRYRDAARPGLFLTDMAGSLVADSLGNQHRYPEFISKG
jgi:hypothetical protein